MFPLHTGDDNVNIGATLIGALMITVCVGHPTKVAVIVTFVPNGIPVIADAVTTPALAVMVALFGFVIAIL